VAQLASNLPWPLRLECTTGLRSATARLVQQELCVRIPRHWPMQEKQKALLTLVRRVHRREAKLAAMQTATGLLSPAPTAARLTIGSTAQLWQFVQTVNATTFQAPVGGVRIGQARRSRLAQVNVRTGVITVSRFCLQDVSETALRYLIIHELAHFFQRGHPPRFWQLVATHCPDYALLREQIQAHHTLAVRAWEADHGAARGA
jgi:hypothetical protein